MRRLFTSGGKLQIGRVVALVLALVVVLAVGTLALPIRGWRTGEQPVPPLAFLAPNAVPQPPRRVWIDTDAACGEGRRTDPDDCFAILALARDPQVEIVGISTVFGNAPLATTDQIARDLAAMLWSSGHKRIPVYRGAAQAREPDQFAPPEPAYKALREAIAAGPLTIVALGPLTNIARALKFQPNLATKSVHLVAVMGRRLGHLFHPSEGSGRGMLFGHGPVFRDFNFAMDEDAAAAVLAMDMPITFIPYDAARQVQITLADLDRLAAQEGAGAWVAERARDWLDYWRHDIGREGFYPFDLLAAAYVVEPDAFRCARVLAWVGGDPTFFIPFWRPRALLVGQEHARMIDTVAAGRALYCPRVNPAVATLGLGEAIGPS